LAQAYTDTEEKDLVIIGGGVAGYVAAIKAGQAGLKVCCCDSLMPDLTLIMAFSRLLA